MYVVCTVCAVPTYPPTYLLYYLTYLWEKKEWNSQYKPEECLWHSIFEFERSDVHFKRKKKKKKKPTDLLDTVSVSRAS